MAAESREKATTTAMADRDRLFRERRGEMQTIHVWGRKGKENISCCLNARG